MHYFNLDSATLFLWSKLSDRAVKEFKTNLDF